MPCCRCRSCWRSFEHGTPLPDRAVVLTIDDAHRSVYNEAFPRLKAAGVPFTLFVAPDPIDSGAESHMTWAQVREVARSGATIGVLPAAGLSMPQRTVQQNAADLVRAVERVEAELGVKPTLLAYPFGSYSSAFAIWRSGRASPPPSRSRPASSMADPTGWRCRASS